MGTASDYFRLTICDNVGSRATQQSLEFSELVAEMETGSADMMTVSVRVNRPADGQDLACIALSKRQLGNLLLFLAMVHSVMDDGEVSE